MLCVEPVIDVARDADAVDSSDSSEDETDDSYEASEAEMEESTEDSEASIDDAAVVTGIGIAVVPLEFVVVLKVYSGEVPDADAVVAAVPLDAGECTVEDAPVPV